MAITLIQERRSERALEALRDLSSPRALLVVRGGERVRVAGQDVVRGDLMLLAEGDRVAADACVSTANDLVVDESLLTGESIPVQKHPDAPVYSGTLVVKGQGSAQVTATGPRTEYGRIGGTLATVGTEKTHLQMEIARVVRLVAVVGIALCVLLAAYYWLTRGDRLDGVLAGITLAMGIRQRSFQ
jgi:Ca2+-transporting ATPase